MNYHRIGAAHRSGSIGLDWRQSSGAAGARVFALPNRKRSSIDRVLLVLCIVAALVMAAYKPVRGTTTCEPPSAAAWCGAPSQDGMGEVSHRPNAYP
jgi:hypothetical protein